MIILLRMNIPAEHKSKEIKLAPSGYYCSESLLGLKN